MHVREFHPTYKTCQLTVQMLIFSQQHVSSVTKGIRLKQNIYLTSVHTKHEIWTGILICLHVELSFINTELFLIT